MSNRLVADIERKREFLLQQLAELDAIHSSTVSANSSQFQHSPVHQTHHVSRSLSTSGTTMSRQVSSHPVDLAEQRHRNFSQQSAPDISMTRTNSGGMSSTQSGHLSFTSNNLVQTSASDANPQPTDVAAWAEQEQPFNPYTYSNEQRAMGFSQSTEHHNGSLESPAEYLNRLGFGAGTPALSVMSSPTIVPSEVNQQQSIASRILSFSMTTPTTPAESLTTATTLASEMSRQNSLCNEPFLQSIEMMKFNSSSSFHENLLDENQQVIQYPPYSSRPATKEDQSQIIFGAGGASHDAPFSQSFSSEVMPQFPSDCFMDNMERSVSNESTSSTSSIASRNKARLQAQNQQAARRALAPKGGCEIEAMTVENSMQSKAQSKNGSQDKVAISKPSYVRPKHDRVYCTRCDEHPDGFRGEHELRRHQDRVHKAMVKKWMCIEPTGEGHPKPILPLSRCKTCTHAKKKYGAYYNAAAHLRRAHFKPKAKGRSKSGKLGKESEKRGGKAGGDWPPMNELKHWMMEVDEPAGDFMHRQQEEADSEDEAEENIDSTASNDFFKPSTQIAYSVSTPFYAAQDMRLDPSQHQQAQQQQQNIDMSMYLPSTSAQNSDFGSFPIQPMSSNSASATFLYQNPSPFVDQNSGPDLHVNNFNFPYQ